MKFPFPNRVFAALAALALLTVQPALTPAQDEKPAAPAVETKPSASATPAGTPETPKSFPNMDTHIYRELSPEPLRLFVYKPKDWKATDKRPVWIHFFGGGFTHGGPDKSVGWAKSAAALGMVGVAPDYRTTERFGSTPLESVADGRLAVRWVEEHAAELGVDPAKVIVSGNSAGGGIALWCGIHDTVPPGSTAEETPKVAPAALILLSPVSDTSTATGYQPKRAGKNADALSPQHHLDAKMPATLLFHGDADKTVPYTQSVALKDKLLAGNNAVEFVTVPGGSHNFSGDLPEWKTKSRDMELEFLKKQKLLPEEAAK